ncbi:hypothetical protein Tco_0409995 [Tanacetum coccineum]
MVNNINNPKKFLLFPRFLQMILEIEPRSTKQYHAFKLTSKMFANMRLNFQGDHMPLLATMLPPPQAAIAGESSREDAQSHPQTVPATITEPDLSHDHVSTPPEPTPATTVLVLQGLSRVPSSYPNNCIFFKTSKVNSQESDLQAHKLLFKEVVGKLVKRVKLLEDKLKAEIPPSSSVPTDDSAGGTTEVPAGATTGPSTVYPSSTTVPTLKVKGWEAAERLQAQELADFEKQRAESLMKDANLARQMSQDFDMTEAQRKRQQEVLASPANYSCCL